ncbi:hypothetical protein B9479_005908 [Cryptococcus floricola]|uniref:Uncharacterized protein n=1 Tax=Cryptococcus floricola TaxID=2591691 RepID=A0A5D3ARW5_9TREE|nr:hypothetical protein B9479_005908 [Cryptococcus floricola]
MPGSKYESSSSYHIGGTSASVTYSEDGSVAIAPSEKPSQVDETTTTGASRITRSEYIAQHRDSREASLLQEELDKYPTSTFKADQSALSSEFPVEMLMLAGRSSARAKTEDAEAAREELLRDGYTILGTDIKGGYTTFLYVDTPLRIQ